MYIRHKYVRIQNHSKLPIFNSPLFDYYQYITVLCIDLNLLEDVQKWVVFPLVALKRCKEVRIVLSNDISNVIEESRATRSVSRAKEPRNLFIQLLFKIKVEMPQLIAFEAVEFDHNLILGLFNNSNIQELYSSVGTEGVDETFRLLNTMHKLTFLKIGTTYKLFELGCVFKNIQRFLPYHVNGSFQETLQFFSNLSLCFPNLKETVIFDDVNIPLLDVLKVLKVNTIELIMIRNQTEWSNCNSSFDSIIMTYVNVPNNPTFALEYLQRCSKNWVFAIGCPTFLIFTNIPKISSLVKYSAALTSNNMSSLISIPIVPDDFTTKLFGAMIVHACPLMFPQGLDRTLNLQILEHGLKALHFPKTDEIESWIKRIFI